MPAAIASGLRGSTRTAASPLASSIDGCEETTAGAPDAIASTIGIPKPSKSDGKTKALRTSVQRRELIVPDIPKRPHTLAAKRRARPGNGELELRTISSQEGEGLEQRVEVLARLDGRRGEEVRRDRDPPPARQV